MSASSTKALARAWACIAQESSKKTGINLTLRDCTLTAFRVKPTVAALLVATDRRHGTCHRTASRPAYHSPALARSAGHGALLQPCLWHVAGRGGRRICLLRPRSLGADQPWPGQAIGVCAVHAALRCGLAGSAPTGPGAGPGPIACPLCSRRGR